MSHFIDEQPRIPEPALVRSAVVSVTAIIAVVFNVQFDLGWLDSVLAIYAAVAPFVAGVAIRKKVVPVSIADFRERKALYTEPPSLAA